LMREIGKGLDDLDRKNTRLYTVDELFS